MRHLVLVALLILTLPLNCRTGEVASDSQEEYPGSTREEVAEKYRKVFEQCPDKKAAEEARKRYNEIMRKRKSQDKLKDEKSGE